MHNPALLLLIAGAFGLAGCAVGPEHRVPAGPDATAFRQLPASDVSAATPDVRWWRHFADPVLDQLMADAAAHNHDLRQARARLLEARALRHAARWDLAPGGAAVAGVERGRAPGSDGVEESWTTGLEAAWEIDLFGGHRRRAEAAGAELGMASADLRSVRIAVLAEVATAYFKFRHAEAAHALVVEQVTVVGRARAAAEHRLAAGRGTRLDTARWESLEHATRALLPALTAEATLQRHRLAVLLGRAPGAFAVPPAVASDRSSATAIAVDSPEELLRRRPDVRRAERALAAATAEVGMDTAALFPRLSLTGVLQFAAPSRHLLGERESEGWAIVPGLRWDVLHFGRLRSRLKAAEARADGALAAYEQAVLRALADVESSLASYGSAIEQLAALEQRRSADADARLVAEEQDAAGSIDPLQVLDTQRSALVSARDVLAAQTDQRLALVGLYRATAGGWDPAGPATGWIREPGVR